jgi:UDP-N-acetylmuramyl tripeptide synthase
MAKNTQLANATVNGQGDNLAARLNNGYLRIYSGTQPTNADTAIGAQVLLAELRFSATAAAATSSGVITFNSITSGTAGNTGTASWFRALSSDGTTVVMDGSVDVTANTPNLVLNSVAISSGASVSVSSFVHTINKATSGL